MPSTQVMTFEEALAASGTRKRHLLLGNGFSRALRNDIFAYDALFNRANFVGLHPNARSAFQSLGTTDFEVVMKALRSAERLVALYAPEQPDLATQLRRDADGLRDVLARTIAQSHPERPHDVVDDAYRACRAFLGHFDGSIYTLNYDLLLYWTLMKTELAPDIVSDDGFRQPEDGPAEYVEWSPSEESQRVFYLHGALHLFDAGHILKKMTWVNTGRALVDQIREALSRGLFPLVVAEGTTAEKKDRIMHSGYLSRGFRSFANIGHSLFVFGFAMSENDAHILDAIGRGKQAFLAVGLYGDPASPSNLAVRNRAAALQAARPSRRPLEVVFYDAKSANVWGMS